MLKNTALIFDHDTIEKLCETLNDVLDDNPEWKITKVDITKHEDGLYTGILTYEEMEVSQ